MNETAQIITAIASLVAALGTVGAVILGLLNARGIREVHAATNGMKTELVKVTGEAKYAEGVEHGEEHPRATHRKNAPVPEVVVLSKPTK